VKLFASYSARYLKRRFHSVRMLRSGLPESDPSRPVIVFLNHASWWDPLVCLQLSRIYFAGRTSFAPIDAAALERYGFFRKLGFYGIQQRSAEGTRAFLRKSRAILSSPEAAIWLTPQSRFADVRERPLILQRGLGALAKMSPHAVFLPLAIEYVFWTEPRPEILVAFGAPILPEEMPDQNSSDWTARFAAALEATQDELAAKSCRRELADWLVLNPGSSSIHPVFDLWCRAKARFAGRNFVREHQPEMRT
jgi:1-acyl-sn-glycerol-3-phosphate acyltransferase